MSRTLASAGFALLCTVSAGAWAASAQVSFVNPEKFTDIGPYGDEREAAANRDALARHIEQLAAKRLPPDQTLKVDVLDVRLAGYGQTWPYALRDVPLLPDHATRPFANEIRVDRNHGAGPSIKLRYQLKQGEQVLASGEEYVTDMQYLDRPNSYPSDDALRYEKRMLDSWFKRKLVQR